MAETQQAREERWRVWMAAAQAGDKIVYEQLLRSLLPDLRLFIRGRVESSVVEDVVQNVLLSIHRARHTYRSERPFGPWVRAVARNAVVDHYRVRAAQRMREVPFEGDEVVVDDEVSEDGAEISPGLMRALEKLPPNQREAVELIQIEGLSTAEAAERAGTTLGALKVRAHRGYRALRAQLGGKRT